MPRCAGCDELIFDATYTVAEGKKWHLGHFCCLGCDVDLSEIQYAKDQGSNPVCLPCYNDKYAVICATCTNPISAGDKVRLLLHLSPECAACARGLFACTRVLCVYSLVVWGQHCNLNLHFCRVCWCIGDVCRRCELPPLSTVFQMQRMWQESISNYIKLYKIKMAQHLDSRCVLISDPSTLGAGAKTRLESSIKKFKPHLIYDSFFSGQHLDNIKCVQMDDGIFCMNCYDNT